MSQSLSHQPIGSSLEQSASHSREPAPTPFTVMQGESALSLETLYHDLPIPYITVRADGVIQRLNPAGATQLSSMEQREGRSLLGFIHPDHREVFREQLQRLATAPPTPPVPTSWLCRLIATASGSLWVKVTAQPSSYEEGAIALVLTDISDLHLQAQRSNTVLERQVRQRTMQLQLAFDCEATLKRITDRVRDSLDEQQILETVVRELACGLGIQGCNAAMFDLSKGTSTIYYEYTAADCKSERRVSYIEAFPELYHQILAGQSFQFCSLLPNPDRGQVALLACPIRDERGILGSLWLMNHSYYCFNEQDIRLVEQVTNQCAIAIRQARLYEAAQDQVVQLERLNQLKDDFLSTISHELRTPITSMKMALQMLGVGLNQELGLFAELAKPAQQQSRIARYFQILHQECEREIRLIDDLLYLQQEKVEASLVLRDRIQFGEWVRPCLMEIQQRMQEKQQHLQVQIPTNLPLMQTDASSLQRVVTELLNNAWKYSPEGAQIQIEAIATPTDLQLRICNTGVEIPAEELPHVFEMFYRVPSTDPWKQGGTGLGLALVKRMVSRLGGSVWVESRAQQTCFTVDLPLGAV
jgi:signal transduction histidine kinase/PAS domain-containing protein